MAISQAERLLIAKTPLGEDTLVLRSLRVQEAISRPYLIQAELIGESAHHKPADLIGKPVGFTVGVKGGTGTIRTFHGICRGFAKVGQLDAAHSIYRLVAVPKFWLLSRTLDCRAWQQKSVKDIAQELIGEGSATPVRFGGSVPTAPRPYTIQYNETDMDFIQRLLDEVGAGYWFDQKASDHEMMVCGSNAEYPKFPGTLVIRGEGDFDDGLTGWALDTSHPPAKVTTVDYDLIKPSGPLQKQAPSVLPTAGAAGFEMFAWPGGIHGHPDVDPAKLFMEQLEATAEVAQATCRDQRVHAGMRVTVQDQVGGGSADWLITEVTHTGYDDTQTSEGGTTHYAAQLTLIPFARTFRVSNPRPRPIMPGMQSAIVVGQGEIDTDKEGRVLVRFLWDRKKQYQGGTSIRVRMVHPYAGAWGGGFFLPRVGDEVLMGFVDGDPDKPVIVGTLYNSDGLPPWPLPANKTVAGMLSRSSEGGMAGDGFVSKTAADTLTSDHTKQANIIRFNDKKGSEEVYLQAQKDQLSNVKNDRKEYVGHDHLEEIKNDRSITVREGNDTFLVDAGTQTTTIEGTHTTTIRTGNQDNTVNTGNQTNTVKAGTQTVTVKGDQTNTVQSGDQTNKVSSGKQTVEVMGDAALTVKTGDRKVKVSAGSYTLEAMQKITLKVGSNKIEISQMGIKIEGLMVTVKGSITSKVSAPLTTVEGSGMLTLKGGIVKLN
jgi:type VI secretion system secreted protein VgrG